MYQVASDMYSSLLHRHTNNILRIQRDALTQINRANSGI